MITRQRLPVATLLLIAVNIAAAFFLLFDPDLVFQYGFDTNEPSFKTAITCLFLHQNVLHLLGNMVFLAAVGPAVEIGAGSIRFLVVYLLGGFAGVITFWFFAHKVGNTAPLIGASGCIAACIAYYALRYSHVKVTVAPKYSVPVYWIIGLWLLLQVAGAFVTIGTVEAGTAYWAHIGGFAMGIVLSLIFSAPKQAQVQQAREAIVQMDIRSPAAKLAATNMFLKDHPGDLEAMKGKADALSYLNEPDEEAKCLYQILEITPEAEQADVLIRLDRINRLDVLPSLRRSMLADRFKGTMPDLSRLLLISIIRVMDDRNRPDALYALAVLDKDEFPDNARAWLKDLFQNYPLHPASELARTKDWAK